MSGKSVYVVDDHAMVRQGLCSLLLEAGYEIAGDCGDVDGGIAGIEASHPQLLLLDLHLGSRSGLELLGEIRNRAIPIHCLVLSMSAQPWYVAESFRAGASGFVQKGSASDELLDGLAAIGRGERFIGSGVADPNSLFRGALDSSGVIDSLSPRERQVLVMVANGASSAAIATELGLSAKTVETYRSRLMTKLDVSDITALVKLALRHGLVSWDRV